MPAPRSRRLVNRLLLLGMSVVIACVSAEIMVRAAAAVRSDVKYLATAGVGNIPRVYDSFEDFLTRFRPHLEPHRIFNNYYMNSLGFADREFAVERPPGTRRIMALGDSFTFGSVSYPQNVMTLIEDVLNRDCGKATFEVMNFGVPATGVWDYRQLHRLAAPRYRPDRVIVHFYMGNDGPDLAFGGTDVPSLGGWLQARSYAWTYLANTVTLLRSVNPLHGLGAVAATGAVGHPARGGERASDRPDLIDGEFQPTLTEEAFSLAAALEAGRLYRGRNLPFRDAWKDTLEVLDTLRTDVLASTGRAPIVILYPSEAQIDPNAFAFARREVEKRSGAVDPNDFDVEYPNRMIMDFCRRAGLSCYDTMPALLAAARTSPAPLYKPRDPHWNLRGNRVAAAAEAEFLRRELCTAE